MAKSFIERIGLERAERLMADATHKAIAETHALGLPVAVTVDGVSSLLYPDGQTTPLEPAQTVQSIRDYPKKRPWPRPHD